MEPLGRGACGRELGELLGGGQHGLVAVDFGLESSSARCRVCA